MKIPSNPFAEGNAVSASVLNAMADVSSSVQKVAGYAGVTANLINGQLSISGLRNRKTVTTANTVVEIYNNSDTDIEYGDCVSFEEAMYDSFERNLDNPNNIKASHTDFSDEYAMHKAGNWGIALEQITKNTSGLVCTSGSCLARVHTPSSSSDLYDDGWNYVSEIDGQKNLQIRGEANRGQILWYDYDNIDVNYLCWAIVNFPVVQKSDLKVLVMSGSSLSFDDGPHLVMVDEDDGVNHATVKKSDEDAPLKLYSIDTDFASGDYLVVNTKAMVAQGYDTTVIPIGTSVNVRDDTTVAYQGLPGYRTISFSAAASSKYGVTTMNIIPDTQPILAKATAGAGSTTVTVQACKYDGTVVANSTYTVNVLPVDA